MTEEQLQQWRQKDLDTGEEVYFLAHSLNEPGNQQIKEGRVISAGKHSVAVLVSGEVWMIDRSYLYPEWEVAEQLWDL